MRHSVTPPVCTWARSPCVHRFGSSLNTHVHFHVCVVDGVFEALPDALEVKFHAATGLNEAAFVPPPRTHRHRYYGVLAPNSPLRAAVTAMAQVAQVVTPDVGSAVTESANTAAGSAGGVPGVSGVGAAAQPEAQAKSKPRPPSHYLWAALIARIYEVFPLICPMCGGQMRIIAFITFSADIHKILEHIGVDAEAPCIAPARGPPLWDDCGAQEQGVGVDGHAGMGSGKPITARLPRRSAHYLVSLQWVATTAPE